ncbi:MAG: hypothetical protein WBP41_20820 [Saprospiraceae bacterium]
MENKLKAILSALCIGLFIVFALASEFLDESSNTQVQLSNCVEKPSFSGNLSVDIEYLYDDGSPNDGAFGRLVITEQLVDDTSGCHYITQQRLRVDFTTNNQGKYTVTNIPFIHHNAEDLFRIDVDFPTDREDDYQGFQQVEVLKYTDSHCIIHHKDPKPL